MIMVAVMLRAQDDTCSRKMYATFLAPVSKDFNPSTNPTHLWMKSCTNVKELQVGSLGYMGLL